ncbi:hypothetical protein [Hyphomicrobium sp.]|uniref:hypothetical protein n=1 Tax=Hyphomicrobium sp. TaxID=82 RepID=UPI000FA9FF37|nr:hypothetical protein [Hyphomicrobium sp.]RUO97776.1 MAG: hypothetical protein EKK30_13625 [Hyphomicrobium sp.]
MRFFVMGLAAAGILASTASVQAQTIRLDDRGFSFRFGPNDRRGDVEGKRASCEVYARIAQVQADANNRFRCGYRGPRWDSDLRGHFMWCRWAPRRAIFDEQRGRAEQLQDCFNRLGDFDDRR